MATVLDETIAAAGYAKVLVTLKPQDAGLAAATAMVGGRLTDAATMEQALANDFMVPSQSQADLLSESLSLGVRGSRRRSSGPTLYLL
jgi:hypothetical protein